eukprot:gene6531-10538_t
MTTQYATLPIEIIFEIIGFSTTETLVSFQLTSKEFYEGIEKHEFLWKSLAKDLEQKHFVNQLKPKELNYKQWYLAIRRNLFTWDEKLSSHYYKISNNNSTVMHNHKSNGDCIARVSRPIKKDIYYFQVSIEKCLHQGDNIMVGAAHETNNFETQTYLGSSSNGYGYFKEGGHVFNSGTDNLEPFNQNDHIGILLDFNEGIISFTKNEKFFFQVVKNLNGEMRPAISSLYVFDQISITTNPIPKFTEFDDNKGSLEYIQKINKYFENFEWM